MLFEFYAMNAKERKTYLTRLKNKKLITSLNDEKYSEIFNRKRAFYKKFHDFLMRDVLDMEEITYDKFQKFISDKECFIAKPDAGEGGRGIEKINVSDFSSTEELYKYITDPEKNFGLIEEVIKQHPIAAKLHPTSLNCLRVGTLVVDGEAHVLYASFKMGVNGRHLDNLCDGGIACHLDLDQGKIIGPGHADDFSEYDVHPTTGIKLVGYELPYAKEIKELVTKAALVVPEFRYVGWDIGISEKGPVIIEGNDYPGWDFPQFHDKGTPRIGIIPEFEKYGVHI